MAKVWGYLWTIWLTSATWVLFTTHRSTLVSRPEYIPLAGMKVAVWWRRSISSLETSWGELVMISKQMASRPDFISRSPTVVDMKL